MFWQQLTCYRVKFIKISMSNLFKGFAFMYMKCVMLPCVRCIRGSWMIQQPTVQPIHLGSSNIDNGNLQLDLDNFRSVATPK